VAVLLGALWVRSYKATGFPTIWRQHTFRIVSGELLMDESSRPAPFPIEASLNAGDNTSPWSVYSRRPIPTVRLNLPLWCIVTAAIVVGASPWIGLRRFSLRTLLIATTLVAVGLGLIVWLANK